MYSTHLISPLGPVVIKASDAGINEVQFKEPDEEGPENTNNHILACKVQLEEYFDGKRQGFDVPLDPIGTSFQQEVWSELLDIPYGHWVSYGDIARKLNNPGAIRAVGAANGSNKIAIIIPCHRVIGSDGSLTGYAAGLERKKWLLRHEGHPNFAADQLSLF